MRTQNHVYVAHRCHAAELRWVRHCQQREWTKKKGNVTVGRKVRRQMRLQWRERKKAMKWKGEEWAGMRSSKAGRSLSSKLLFCILKIFLLLLHCHYDIGWYTWALCYDVRLWNCVKELRLMINFIFCYVLYIFRVLCVECKLFSNWNVSKYVFF